MNEHRTLSQIVDTILPSIPWIWCFTDGSWKKDNIFSGQGWFSTLESFDGLLGRWMLGLVSLFFMRRWKRYSGQWNAWGNNVNFMLRLQRIVLNWWRWFQDQKYSQILQIIWKMSRSWKKLHPIRDYLCTKDAKFKDG